MESLFILCAVALGGILGGVIGWQMRGGRAARLEERAQRASALEAQLTEATTQTQSAKEKAHELEVALGSLRARFEAHQVDEAQKKQDQVRMVATFKAAAHEIVEERSKAFDTSSKKQIGDLVKPLKEQLDGFQKQLRESAKDASRERTTLEAEVKHLKEMNHRISNEAQNLTRALKGDSKAQGNWGEMVLERVLESSGLQEGREYETEVSITEEGHRKRPDVIVHLPQERQVVIDSKVSLNDYDAYCEAETQDERDAALKRLVVSIRTHVKGLSGKSYQHLTNVSTLDYVLMFMPIEAAFTEAMRCEQAQTRLLDTHENKETFFEEAMGKKVLIVTPTTLLAVLRTIDTMWKNERQTANALEIARQAGALHDKFVGFAHSLEQIGQRIGQAQTSYDEALGKLTTGRGNLVSRVKKLEALGVKTSKSIPPSLNVEGEGQEPKEIESDDA